MKDQMISLKKLGGWFIDTDESMYKDVNAKSQSEFTIEYSQLATIELDWECDPGKHWNWKTVGKKIYHGNTAP